jgi:hypothetical protein
MDNIICIWIWIEMGFDELICIFFYEFHMKNNGDQLTGD